jgi:uncharacterized protein YcbK (DUF882 family)
MKRYQVSAIIPLIACLSVVATVSAASLRATSSSQLVQNQRADEDQLSRMEGSAMTARWVRLQLLEAVPAKTSGYYLHAVRVQNRYLRPWTRLFLSRLSNQYRAKFGKQLRVTSLLRTAEYQRSLQGRNGNAASPEGPKRSAHLTGASLDISKKGMTGTERQWLRRVLTSLRGNGYIYAIEEYQQPVFHILVHRTYADYVDRKSGSTSASTHQAD